jgi:lysophospholipase L1-like esterase
VTLKQLFFAAALILLFGAGAPVFASEAETGGAVPSQGFADRVGPGAVAPAAAPSPWDAEFAAFASSDSAHPPPDGGVLVVGSSSIRLWNDLETQFKASPTVLKRGFGGSQLADCVKYVDRLVVRYRPRTVVVYAGDNDLAAGATPAQVRQRFAELVQGVRRALPDTRIAYISIKPSPSRAALLPQIRATNALIRDYVATQSNAAYIDVFTPMLDTAGTPRRELFRDDALHLNPDGYRLWQALIAPYLG